MKTIALAAAALYATPSFAACHHYSVWKNPWPQSCAATEKAAVVPLRSGRGATAAEQLAENPPIPPGKPMPPFTISQWDTIILRPDPNRTDEEGRAQAIEILKQVMGQ